MKEIPVTIHHLSDTTPSQMFLCAQDLALYAQAEDIIQLAEKQAKKQQEQAKNSVLAAESEKQKIITEAKATAKEIIQRLQQEYKQSVIKDTVHWLVTEEILEAQIIISLEEKIRTEMAHAFRTLVADLDQNQLLMSRLQDELNKLKDEKSYLLRVPTARFDTTQTDLETHQLTDRLQLIIDDTLSQNAVILETPFFLLKIDITKHIEAIATYLKTPRNTSQA